MSQISRRDVLAGVAASLAAPAWAKEPYKVIWATRSDGKFLSLTYLKEQELIAWEVIP